PAHTLSDRSPTSEPLARPSVRGRARRSKNFLDHMNRPFRANLADSDGKQTIEECVLGSGGLETRHRAEIVVGVIADAGERHVYQGTVVGFECHPQVEGEASVAVGRYPVAASRE